MAIILENISKSYGKNCILHNISLEIPESSFHVILGPSGCGKSTLLSIISGISKADSGSILFNGKRLDLLPQREKDIGFVFQDYSLFPHLTVYDNIAFGLRADKMNKKEIAVRVKKYLSITGMTMYHNSLPGELSGGQKQRVALARALVLKPSIMLFDEPLSHLDQSLNDQLKKDLLEIQREEKFTAIYVTHNQEEAFDLASRISILNGGTIEQTADPDDIHHSPSTRFVASFMGIENIFTCQVIDAEKEHSVLRIKNVGDKKDIYLYAKYYPLFEKRGTVQIAVHPEHIVLNGNDQRNALTGTVKSVIKRGFASIIKIDSSGHTFYVKNYGQYRVSPGETVHLSIPPESIHPLCGRVNRRPEGKRVCSCGDTDAEVNRKCSGGDDDRSIDNI